MSTDLDHKFELAVDLRQMEVAHAVLVEQDSKTEALDTERYVAFSAYLFLSLLNVLCTVVSISTKALNIPTYCLPNQHGGAVQVAPPGRPGTVQRRHRAG